MADNNNESYNSEDTKKDVNRRPNKGQRQMGRGQGNEISGSTKDVVKDRLEMMSGPTTNLVSKEGVSAKKFTGRCRLFVGNLPPSITDEEFRKMFQQFGKIDEVFLHPQKGFGFVKLDTRQNAENAKAALDFTIKDGKSLRVRFATHGAALKVKNLSPWVSNELLEASFAIFGDVERAVVIVDDRGRPVGEGIVEYARRQSAHMAIKRCQEGCLLLTSSPRPVVVEPFEQRDEEEGLPEKNFQKSNKQYLKEREIGPRLAEPGTSEFEFANRWKKLYELEQQKREHLEKEIEEGHCQLDEQMEYAIYEHEANLLRETARTVNVVEKSVQTSKYMSTVPCLESLSEDLSMLLDHGPKPDVVLTCGDHKVKAHRIILSNRSKVLAAMLNNDMAESRTGTVEIKEMDQEALGHFVRYLYTGKLPDLTVQTARRFYEAADKYAMKALMKRSARFLEENLDLGNACEMLVLADAHSDAGLKESVMEYILRKEIHLQQDEHWLTFCKSHSMLATEVLNLYCKHQRNK